MKTIIRLTLICLAAACLLSGFGTAEKAQETPKIILYTCYENLFPDGLVFEAGCVDEKGNCWTIGTVIPDPDGSVNTETLLAALLEEGKMTPAGQITGDDLFDLKGLIACTEDRGSETEAVAEGGGAECSCALIYGEDGTARRILLGVSGDSRFENTDPNAQALYLLLRNLFPEVTNYAWGNAGPQGYPAVSLIDFCGWQGIDFSEAAVTGYEVDCEAGLIPVEITGEDRDAVLDLILNSRVTGKASATMVTGGTTVYVISDGDGNGLGSLELYRGLLVWRDGMYSLGR